MSKTPLWLAVAIAFSLLLAWPGSAQIVGRPPEQLSPQERVRQEPCWKQVGISKTAIEERDAISRERRSQVEAVCADSSLTLQQKQHRIREIRQQARQRSEALISPQQDEELRACQNQRAASHPPSPGVHHGGGETGPCGELTTPAAPHPQSERGNPGEENRLKEDETARQD
jgi:hypothetical protein